MNDRAKYKGRMAIYAMAGVYLLAQAYYMYKDIPTSSGTDKILMSIFMVVFAVIGAGMVIMGVTKSYKAIKEDYNAVPEEEKKDAETSEGEEAAVEAKEVAELEDKIEESKDGLYRFPVSHNIHYVKLGNIQKKQKRRCSQKKNLFF